MNVRLSSVFSMCACLILLIHGETFGGTVYLEDDSPEIGTLRTVVAQASDGETVDFATRINPVLGSTSINIAATNLSISGNIQLNGIPETSITRPASSGTPLFDFSDGVGNGLSLANLAFSDIKVTRDTVPAYGGGLIGGRSTLAGMDSLLGSLHNIHIRDSDVAFGNSLDGGGLIGVYATTGAARIGDVTNINLSSNRISLADGSSAEAGRFWGAGLIGTFSESGSASIGNVSGMFVDNSVHTATYINGAGLVGSFLEFAPG